MKQYTTPSTEELKIRLERRIMSTDSSSNNNEDYEIIVVEPSLS